MRETFTSILVVAFGSILSDFLIEEVANNFETIIKVLMGSIFNFFLIMGYLNYKIKDSLRKGVDVYFKEQAKNQVRNEELEKSLNMVREEQEKIRRQHRLYNQKIMSTEFFVSETNKTLIEKQGVLNAIVNSISKVQLKLDSLYGYLIREDLKLSRQKSFKERIDELHEDIEAEKKTTSPKAK
jgi:hypothetical protein